jgi:hypothetical protein
VAHKRERSSSPSSGLSTKGTKASSVMSSSGGAAPAGVKKSKVESETEEETEEETDGDAPDDDTDGEGDVPEDDEDNVVPHVVSSSGGDAPEEDEDTIASSAISSSGGDAPDSPDAPEVEVKDGGVVNLVPPSKGTKVTGGAKSAKDGKGSKGTKIIPAKVSPSAPVKDGEDGEGKEEKAEMDEEEVESTKPAKVALVKVAPVKAIKVKDVKVPEKKSELALYRELTKGMVVGGVASVPAPSGKITPSPSGSITTASSGSGTIATLAIGIFKKYESLEILFRLASRHGQYASVAATMARAKPMNILIQMIRDDSDARKGGVVGVVPPHGTSVGVTSVPGPSDSSTTSTSTTTATTTPATPSPSGSVTMAPSGGAAPELIGRMWMMLLHLSHASMADIAEAEKVGLLTRYDVDDLVELIRQDDERKRVATKKGTGAKRTGVSGGKKTKAKGASSGSGTKVAPAKTKGASPGKVGTSSGGVAPATKSKAVATMALLWERFAQAFFPKTYPLAKGRGGLLIGPSGFSSGGSSSGSSSGGKVGGKVGSGGAGKVGGSSTGTGKVGSDGTGSDDGTDGADDAASVAQAQARKHLLSQLAIVKVYLATEVAKASPDALKVAMLTKKVAELKLKVGT